MVFVSTATLSAYTESLCQCSLEEQLGHTAEAGVGPGQKAALES